ncbi:hypothetical protein [Haloplasma contractile]|uniref:Uncharacterized protein n=1 Tax=Haloplasma contractile SSD-17B TaxID=1033810 RepID=U2EB80_9MOLU|nr:hypothetical protein [Haloplasma contractile]ERJ12041.1 hypothetical protein HLPCO_001955 [Haloplasma contractile SSD-17B]
MDRQTVDLSHGRGFPGIRRDLRPQQKTETRVANKLNNFIDETRVVTKDIRTNLVKHGEENQSILKQFKRQNIMYESLLYHISEQEKINRTLEEHIRNIEKNNQTLLDLLSMQINNKLEERKETKLQPNIQNFKSTYSESIDSNEKQFSNLKTDNGTNIKSKMNIGNKRIEGDEGVFNSTNTKLNQYSMSNDESQDNSEKIKVDARILELLELQYNLDTYNLKHDNRLEFMNIKKNETETNNNEEVNPIDKKEIKENGNKINPVEKTHSKSMSQESNNERFVEDNETTDEKELEEETNKHSQFKKESIPSTKLNQEKNNKNDTLGAISRYYIEKNQGKKQKTQTSIKKKKLVTKTDKKNQKNNLTDSNKNKGPYKIKVDSRFIDFLETEYNLERSKLNNNPLIEIVNKPVGDYNHKTKTRNELTEKGSIPDKDQGQLKSPLKIKPNKLPQENKDVLNKKSISDSNEHQKKNDPCCNLFKCGDQISVRYPNGEWNRGLFIAIKNERLIWRNTETGGNKLECTSCDRISIRKLS